MLSLRLLRDLHGPLFAWGASGMLLGLEVLEAGGFQLLHKATGSRVLSVEEHAEWKRLVAASFLFGGSLIFSAIGLWAKQEHFCNVAAFASVLCVGLIGYPFRSFDFHGSALVLPALGAGYAVHVLPPLGLALYESTVFGGLILPRILFRVRSLQSITPREPASISRGLAFVALPLYLAFFQVFLSLTIAFMGPVRSARQFRLKPLPQEERPSQNPAPPTQRFPSNQAEPDEGVTAYCERSV